MGRPFLSVVVPLLYDREARFAGKTKYPLGRLVALQEANMSIGFGIIRRE